MSRVTPTQVAEAYKSTGLKPITGNWLDGPSASPTCGCGMGAMFMAAGGDPRECYSFEISNKLDLPWEYVSGFSDGFDGYGSKRDDEDYLNGHEDGQAAAELVHPEK